MPEGTEEKTEVLRVGFWKEGATQSPELKGKKGKGGRKWVESLRKLSVTRHA